MVVINKIKHLLKLLNFLKPALEIQILCSNPVLENRPRAGANLVRVSRDPFPSETAQEAHGRVGVYEYKRHLKRCFLSLVFLYFKAKICEDKDNNYLKFMLSDLTFITNEKGQNLKERFEVLIKDTKFFDCLVGYFYASGFHAIYESLKKTEKVRVLIGISTNPQTYDLMLKARSAEQSALQFSSSETKEKLGEIVEKEMEEAEDSEKTEGGVCTFIDWVKNGKLEIRAYPSDVWQKLVVKSLLGPGVGQIMFPIAQSRKSGKLHANCL